MADIIHFPKQPHDTDAAATPKNTATRLTPEEVGMTQDPDGTWRMGRELTEEERDALIRERTEDDERTE